MEFWIKAAQLILSLSLLIVLHEFGHYIPARLFKTKVEKFYLFFDYKFSLFKKKIKDTEWGIGWIPLGGYVKIAGMIDESMDKEQMKQEPKPWEFRSKPPWQRLIIMIGGIVVNLIVGFVIYAMVLFTWGSDKISPEDLEHGVTVAPEFEKYGFQDGDQLISVEGEDVEDVLSVNTEILLRGAREITVKHPNGELQTINLPEDADYEMFETGAFQLFTPRMPAKIDTVFKEYPAGEAGVEGGDIIKAVNGMPIAYWDEFVDTIHNSSNAEVILTVERNGQLIDKTVMVDSAGKIGVVVDTDPLKKHVTHVDYSFFAAFPAGLSKAYWTLHDYASQLKFVFTKKGASSIGGFGAFGNLFAPTWDWHSFWLNTALISIILAFMNFLPIPALDGGHIMFLLYEMITGREPHQKVLEYAQLIGFILILGLVIFANGNDIYRWLTGG